jgi:signal transduction histidine kinase
MTEQSAFYRIILILAFICQTINASGSNSTDFSLYTNRNPIQTENISAVVKNQLIDTKLIGNTINKTNTSDAAWVKVVVHNKQLINTSYLVISNPILDEVTIYYSVKDSQTVRETTPINARFFNDQNYIFLTKSDTIYLKVTTRDQLLFNVNVSKLERITESNTTRDNIVFFYVGIMLVMFLYNLFLFLTTRDMSYLFYISYILFVALTQLTFHGFLNRYLPENLNYLKTNAIYLFGALSGLTTLIFLSNFIDTKKNVPKLHWIIRFLITIDIITIVLTFINKQQLSYTLINLNAGIGSFIVLIIAGIVALKNNRSAKFFLIAWSLFLTSVIIFVLKDFGVVPNNLITTYILLFGSSIEVTLLSLALADKINILKREKELAQAEALNSARENERITIEQNLILEQKVVERTTALTEINNNLSVALHDLKQAQTQLVESGKMASLGQLTAGIAHEINNPINFVTSNIKPLERDINDIYKLQDITEKLLDGNQTAINQIKKYKNEIDFDYLKNEINFLLKGIHEGSSRTAEIVKGLRIFSRVDEDDIKLANINEGLDSTIIIINNQLNNKIAIEKDYANLPFVECYPGKLNQVFLNLISNAIYAVRQRFQENDGGKLIIKTKHENNNVIITISDNGTGMSPETQKKLFEPFFTTKPVGEGTGLGLSITYNTIKKHNGSVSVESALGEGTIFKITIPINQPNE